MGRRTGLPWAPTSLPEIQRQIDRVGRAGIARIRTQPGGDELADKAEAELADLAEETLYWVSRDMVELASSAAKTLPEWSPAAAIPDNSGLLAWAKPAGLFAWPVPGSSERVVLPVDAMAWRVTNRQVAVHCAFRTERFAGQLDPELARLPLLSHPVGIWDLEEPVPHHLADGRVSPLSVLGAAWLLMSQVRFVQTRTIGTHVTAEPRGTAPAGSPKPVSLIELRRTTRGTPESAGENSQRQRSNKRWWVEGHWRQQACGPQRALRKPIWISPYMKGDPDANTSDRVNVWRR